jgi:hypothetical protein
LLTFLAMQTKQNNTNSAQDAGQIVLNIKSRHATLSEAVKASGMDLSYNPEEAMRKIRGLEIGRGGRVSAVFLMENNDVFFVFDCDIPIFQKFEPFISVMDNSAFYPVKIADESVTILRNLALPRDCRALIRKSGLTVTTL